jgi:trimeric autotransporter adhesin
MQAVVPAPDGGYPGGNTAEGYLSLGSLTTGSYNTALGAYSLLSNTTGNFNTGVGAGTLLANTADQNTATGAGRFLAT